MNTEIVLNRDFRLSDQYDEPKSDAFALSTTCLVARSPTAPATLCLSNRAPTHAAACHAAFARFTSLRRPPSALERRRSLAARTVRGSTPCAPSPARMPYVPTRPRTLRIRAHAHHEPTPPLPRISARQPTLQPTSSARAFRLELLAALPANAKPPLSQPKIQLRQGAAFRRNDAFRTHARPHKNARRPLVASTNKTRGRHTSAPPQPRGTPIYTSKFLNASGTSL